MREAITRAVLAVSGVILGFVGGALMMVPRTFLGLSQVYIDPDPSLMSELAAPSGILLLTSGFMILGAVRLRFANPALLIGALVYGSYGFGRLVSMGLNGVPSESLIIATAIELGIAALLAAIQVTTLYSKKPNLAEWQKLIA